jgi:hypothetical protein
MLGVDAIALIATGQGAQRDRISAARQWHAWFGRHGGIARFANAEAVGESRFVLGGLVESGRRFHVSPDCVHDDGFDVSTAHPQCLDCLGISFVGPLLDCLGRKIGVTE